MNDEKDSLDINFIYVKNNLHALDNLIDEYVEFILDCKTAGGIKEVVHLLIEDLYQVVENDIMLNDILEKVNYLNKGHIVKDID